MKTRVLLIDDEVVLLRATNRVLARSYEVVPVSTAEAALEQIASARFDVVISDFSMPGENGVELARRVRAKGFTGVYVLLTAVSDSPELIQALSEGCLDGVIAKPWEPGTLCDQVQALLAACPSAP